MSRSPRARAPLLALLAVLALAACDTTSPSTSGSTAPQTIGPPPSANGSVTPVTIDTTLLAVLPREVGSTPVIESPEGEADAQADAVLPTIATAAVAAVAVDAPTDLVYVLVVRLRPDVLTADRYRDWRDSYDEGACLGVSNVMGHAEVTIAGHKVFIGTCVNGLRTYHTWLQERSILISASSTGTRELGVVLFGTLRT